jgi:hypothetical protein
VKADLDLRLYEGDGSAVSISSVTVTEGADRHYTIGALPDGSTVDPHTLTYRVTGQVGTERWPALESPPDVLIAALGVTGEAGTLEVTLYRDAVEYVGASLTIAEPATGDYSITGLPDLSGEWKAVIQSSLSIVSVDYAGAVTSEALVTIADLRQYLGQEWTEGADTDDDDLIETSEARAVSWLERETHRRLRTGTVSPLLHGQGGHGGLLLPAPITATTSAGLPALASLEIRYAIGGDWTEIDLDDVEIVEIPDLTTHELWWSGGVWPIGPLRIRPTYLTGYQATGSPATPPDLAEAICEKVAHHFLDGRQATKRGSAQRDLKTVYRTIRRYTNPHKFQTLIDRVVI